MDAETDIIGMQTGSDPWKYADSGFVKANYRGELRNEFGDWIERLGDWDWFVTRTLGRPVDMGFTQPGRETARMCLRDLITRSEARRMVAVFEDQKRGVPHLHVLLETAKGLNGGVEQERDFQKWGIARWKVYRHEQGAKYYLGKYLTKDVTEMYIMLDGPKGEREVAGKRLDRMRC